jgi:hypothetical protein
MVDNFDAFRKLLNFTEKGDFYFIQCLLRRKDHPDLSKSEKCIDSFYIYNLDEYDHLIEKMKAKADSEGARVYVRVNKRNDKRIALAFMAELARKIYEEDHAGVRKIYTSMCGKYGSEKERKLFLVDCDFKDQGLLIDVMGFISELREQHKMPELMHCFIPTKNGFHILTSPFNIHEFKKKYMDIQVDGDASTLLYCNL